MFDKGGKTNISVCLNQNENHFEDKLLLITENKYTHFYRSHG